MSSVSRSNLFRLLYSNNVVRRARYTLQNAVGVHLLKQVPLGTEIFVDLQELPAFQCRTLFDVGANVGQTAAHFKFWYPNARIFCFEPASSNFRALQDNTADLPHVSCHQLALGRSEGRAELATSGLHTMFSLNGDKAGPTESVLVQTVDHFAAAHGVTHIDYLKVDTEGHDLAVIDGASGLLRDAKIDLVEVEAGMNPTDSHHVPFEALKQRLEGFGFLLFGLYDQRHEWPTGRPVLRRCNALFISPRAVAANQRAPR